MLKLLWKFYRFGSEGSFMKIELKSGVSKVLTGFLDTPSVFSNEASSSELL